MANAFSAAPGIDVITRSVDIPTLGSLAVNGAGGGGAVHGYGSGVGVAS